LVLLSIYILIGPLAWLGLLVLLLIGRSRMMRLRQKAYPLPERLPKVTVIIPAKDEAERIEQCVRSVLAMDFASFDVIAIDDRSRDNTGQILDRLEPEAKGRLRVVHVAPDALPAGWLGKCNALFVGSRAATQSDWLLFVDSDVIVQQDALRATLALAAHRKYDVLTILTRLECDSFLERMMLPLCAGLWSVMFRISLTNDDNGETAAANGQFFLVRRTAYEAVGGHAAVRDQIVEDVELMRLLKSRGFRTRFMFGSHLAATKMHSTLRQMFHGWGRIFSGTARRETAPILLATTFLIVAGFSVYPALFYGIVRIVRVGDGIWLLAGVCHWLLMMLFLAMIYRGSGNRARYMHLFPVSASLLVAFLAYSLRLCRTGRVTWRGTQFSAGAPTATN